MAKSWKKLLPGLVLLAVVGPGCYRVDEIDITTGRFRHTRAFLNLLPVSRRTDDSFLTGLLPLQTVWYPNAKWRRVNTFAPGSTYSPHEGFHGAYHVVWRLKAIMEDAAEHDVRVTEAAKQKVALNILRLWQETNTDFIGGGYVDRFRALVHQRMLDSERDGYDPLPIMALDVPPLHATTKPTKPSD